MRPADLFRFALAALYRHKLRTLLTLSGVVVGSFLLVVSVSVGQGVEAATLREFRKYGQLRRIEVFPGYGPVEKQVPPADLVVTGEMSEAKRKRIRQSLVRRWPRKNPRRSAVTTLSLQRLRQLEQLDHVVGVHPTISETCHVYWDGRPEEALVTAPDPADEELRSRLLSGTMPEPSGREVLVHEYLLYLWGLKGDDAARLALGRKLRVEYRRRGMITAPVLGVLTGGGQGLSPMDSATLESALARLGRSLDRVELSAAEKALLQRVLGVSDTGPRRPPEQLIFAEEFTIVGVIGEWMEAEGPPRGFPDWSTREADLFLPRGMAEQLFSKNPRFAEAGFLRATVTVDHEDRAAEVNQQITAMGLRSFSLGAVVQRVRKNVLLLGIAAAFLAAMALVVAAVGITNMMLMSVLERTHEIGVMKAVGARDRHIQLVFLLEGVVLGAVGGGLGLLIGWLASFPGDRIARAIVEKQLNTTLEHSLFVFPAWLVVGVPLFAVVVATLAAVYPSRRAARINPIDALRHE